MSTYYKILPENLICRRFQYREGLNIDTNKIDTGECGYGLHFADTEHILSFCDYGTMIAEVEIPDGSVVYHFDTKSKADKLILKNLRQLWSVDTIKALIQEGVDVESYRNGVIYEALSKGYPDVAKYLIEQGANNENYDSALLSSSQCGYLDIVKYLIAQGADIHILNDRALYLASRYGHLNIVKYLVEQGADIHADDDDALQWASSGGHLDIVRYLVEQGADIHADDDDALRWASLCGHFDIVKYLVEQGADVHTWDDWAIRHAKTSEIKEYLKSLK